MSFILIGEAHVLILFFPFLLIMSFPMSMLPCRIGFLIVEGDKMFRLFISRLPMVSIVSAGKSYYVCIVCGHVVRALFSKSSFSLFSLFGEFSVVAKK